MNELLKKYIERNKELLEPYAKNDVELSIVKRWSDGTEHHPRSKELMKNISQLDFCFNNDYFRFKVGGDGDNGEILMYLMDMFFELKDKE
jgi:hypothetical protein